MSSLFYDFCCKLEYRLMFNVMLLHTFGGIYPFGFDPHVFTTNREYILDDIASGISSFAPCFKCAIYRVR